MQKESGTVIASSNQVLGLNQVPTKEAFFSQLLGSDPIPN